MNQPTSKSPAEVYQEFLVPGIHARWTPIFLEYARPGAGDRVLDVACGTGIVTRTVAPRVGTAGTVVGLDISADMLGVAQGLPTPGGAAVEWVEGDATGALPGGPFDLVLCQQGLQFFSDRARALEEMHRVLAPEGRAVVSVWKGLDHHPLYRALIEAEARYLDVPVESVATPFLLGDADELRAELTSAGFGHVEIGVESHPVQFPSPERFVQLTVLAAASIIPETEMDAKARSEFVETVGREVDANVQEYVEDDSVVFPMHAHIAVARHEPEG